MFQRTLPEQIYIGHLKTIQFIDLFLKFKPESLLKHWKLNVSIICGVQKQYLRSRLLNYTFWHCADLWFAIMQKMLFSECTVAFFGHCNLLNSRQFSFINQAETGVKSYKEQIKLTLFRDWKPSWIFNKDAVDILSAKVATLHELQLHTSQELTFFFERDSSLAICSIFDSFHVGLFIPKITETRSSFHVLAFQTKHHDQM